MIRSAHTAKAGSHLGQNCISRRSRTCYTLAAAKPAAPATYSGARRAASPQTPSVGSLGKVLLQRGGFRARAAKRSPRLTTSTGSSEPVLEADDEEGFSQPTFKLPGALTILFLLIVVVAASTYVIPAGSFTREMSATLGTMVPVPGSYQSVLSTPQGIVAVLIAPVLGFAASLDTCFFCLMIGGFLNVVNATGAVDAGIQRALAALKGREDLMIPILMTTFALLGAGMGFQEETIPFYSILIPVMVKAGYDAVTGIGTILLGAGIGLIGALSNPFATVIAADAAGISFLQGSDVRIAILVASWALTVLHVTRYAKKVKDDPSQSVVFETRRADLAHFVKEDVEATWREGCVKKPIKLTLQQKAILILFGSAFAIMIWGVSMGGWGMNDMSALFIGFSILVGLVARQEEEKFTTNFVAGAQDLLGVALVIGLARGIVQVMSDGMITDTILNAMAIMLEGLPNVIFINVMYWLQVALSFLVPSSSGLAVLTMPIISPLADFSSVPRHLLVTAFQAANGLVNILTPTSGVVMGALAIGRVPFTKWLKFCLPLMAQIAVVTMAILSLALLL